MPIFQEALEGNRLSSTPTRELELKPNPESRRSRASEESIRTEFCEGAVVGDLVVSENTEEILAQTENGYDPEGGFERAQLIRRLKRGVHTQTEDRQVSRPTRPATSVLSIDTARKSSKENLTAGLELERPRSALHSGDFTQERALQKTFEEDTIDESPLFNPTPLPWFAASPPRDFGPFQQDPRIVTSHRRAPASLARSRAPSLSSSLSSSFAFRAPTSPLVHSESNDDIELETSLKSVDISSNFRTSYHHHTFQPSSSFHSNTSLSNTSSDARPSLSARRDSTHPYQAHQPRRSISQTSQVPALQHASDLHPRRPSCSFDSPPAQHTSMVGSYEESILRGRMSTTPSKPLDFVAQIGVLGLGKCRPQLRCPPHVTVPFPAVFYSYGTTTHGRRGNSEDGPSPYVGQIDLENGLQTGEERKVEMGGRHVGKDQNAISDLGIPSVRMDPESRGKQKVSRAPPGGSYRIPQKGQLQIIIKNPNKTAVKLFLVPYDLEGMEPGTKTFLRQRSYSAGPDVNLPISSPSPASSDRPTLRYLVHIHICSPSRGRFYLYKSIRVVFANRVPDGKEKLQNSIQIPEPRYSSYKPGRESISTLANSSLAADKAWRRRSSGFLLGDNSRMHDEIEALGLGFNAFSSPSPRSANDNALFTNAMQGVDTIPFSLTPNDASTFSSTLGDSTLQSPTSSSSGHSRPGTAGRLPDTNTSERDEFGVWDKLRKGDAGYGGGNMKHSGTRGGEGLLAMEIKGRGVWRDT